MAFVIVCFDWQGGIMWCMGILDRHNISAQVRGYGAAGGGRPRVVWPNGILASTAVGLFVQLVAPWHEHPISTAYLEYDGNSHTLKPSNRLPACAGRRCSHFHPAARGDAFFGRRRGLAPFVH